MDVSLNSNVSKYGLQLVLNDIVNYFCEAHGGYQYNMLWVAIACDMIRVFFPSKFEY
jgi:hypothetical protein